MIRKIKLHTGAYTQVDDTKKKVMTQSEWMQEGKRRFGTDFMNWKFQCPMCGHIASIRDFKDAGADDPNCAYQECIGRHIGKGSPQEGDSSGCNWVAYGLFGIPNGKGIIVISDDDGTGTECFDFAESEVIGNIFDNPELVRPECSKCKCRNCFSKSECCPECEGTIYGCEEYSETDIYNPDLLEGGER